MNSTVKTAAAVAPTLLSRFKLRYLVLGVAAYYGMKLLRSRGALPKQADAALDLIDHGIDIAKEKVGFATSSASSGMATGSKSSKADPQSIHADAPRTQASTSSASGVH